MAKYTIGYACGHGQFKEELFGPMKERDQRIEWLSRKKVCLDCYRAAKTAEDAVAVKLAKIYLVVGDRPEITVEVTGQLEAHKEVLRALGYRWSESSQGGLSSWLSDKKPKRALAKRFAPSSIQDLTGWLEAENLELEEAGYFLKADLTDIDVALLRKAFADQSREVDAKAVARAELARIKEADPQPGRSALRQRIADLEQKAGAKWNGKLYGRKSSWNFYVGGVNHTATDPEVEEREALLVAMSAWNAKYADLIKAAK
jgi:hypothetical protein